MPFYLTSFAGAILLLSFVGGYLDAALFLSLAGLFVGMQTGNVIAAAAAVERGGTTVGPRLAVIPAWVAGIVAGSLACAALARARVGRRAALVAMLGVSAVTMGAALAAGVVLTPTPVGSGAGSAAFDSGAVYVVACVAAAAYGWLFAILRALIPEIPMSLMQTGNLGTFVEDVTTLSWDACMRGTVHGLLAANDKRRLRLPLFGSAIVGFVCGAFAGGWLQSIGGFAALALPISLICLLAADTLAARLAYGEGPPGAAKAP